VLAAFLAAGESPIGMWVLFVLMATASGALLLGPAHLFWAPKQDKS
jgi:hypothetical protein